MRIVRGDRIGRTGQLVVGCSVVVLNEDRDAVLLTRRVDNGRWCLPSGRMETGESVEETAIRETWEETGLRVRLVKLTGVYSDPNAVSEYADGNRYQVVGISFRAEIESGTAGPTEEVSQVGFFPLGELDSIDIIEPHRRRIEDALSDQREAFFR